jgi:hypothetical protein
LENLEPGGWHKTARSIEGHVVENEKIVLQLKRKKLSGNEQERITLEFSLSIGEREWKERN